MTQRHLSVDKAQRLHLVFPQPPSPPAMLSLGGILRSEAPRGPSPLEACLMEAPGSLPGRGSWQQLWLLLLFGCPPPPLGEQEPRPLGQAQAPCFPQADLTLKGRLESSQEWLLLHKLPQWASHRGTGDWGPGSWVRHMAMGVAGGRGKDGNASSSSSPSHLHI